MSNIRNCRNTKQTHKLLTTYGNLLKLDLSRRHQRTGGEHGHVITRADGLGGGGVDAWLTAVVLPRVRRLVVVLTHGAVHTQRHVYVIRARIGNHQVVFACFAVTREAVNEITYARAYY